jgi:hypothetical protein
MAVILVRQTVAAVGLALLSAGLLTTITEAAVLAVGLLLIGPGVTLVAPRITMPAALTNGPEAVRWAIAIVVSTALAVLLLLVGGPGLYTGTYTGLLVVLTISGIAFRLLLGAAAAGPPAVERAAPGVAAAVTTTLTMVSTLVLWLALPTIALADDCSDLGQGELTSCAQLLAAAALMPPIVGLLFGAAILNRAIQGPPPPPRKKTPPPPTFTGGRYVPGRGKQPGQYGPKPPPKSEEPPGFWDSLTKW